VCLSDFAAFYNPRWGTPLERNPCFSTLMWRFSSFSAYILGTLGCLSLSNRMPVSSLFVPSAVYLLEPSTGATAPPIWPAGLALQFFLIIVFVYLQSRRIATLERLQPARAPDSIPQTDAHG
jgi:hypothetical protein